MINLLYFPMYQRNCHVEFSHRLRILLIDMLYHPFLFIVFKISLILVIIGSLQNEL